MRQKTVRKYYGYPKKCDREFDIFHKYDNWATTVPPEVHKKNSIPASKITNDL